MALFGLARQFLLRLRKDLAETNLPAHSSSKKEALLHDNGLNGDPATRAPAAGHPTPLLCLRDRVRSPCLSRNPVVLRLLDTLLVAAAVALSVLNMLVAMTYNPGLLAAVVAGEAIGACALFPIGGSDGGASSGGCH